MSHNSFSIASENLAEFKHLVTKKMGESGKPSLAILFVNADLDLAGVHEFMDECQITHIGASSAGELFNDKHAQGMYAGLFTYFPEDSFKVYHSSESTTHLSGEKLGIFAQNAFENPGIYMLIASKNTLTDLYIKAIQEITSPNIPLYGGHALDNLKLETFTVFANHYLAVH